MGVEGDENTGFFHGVINRKRRQLAIRGVMVDGQWVVKPARVKNAFRGYYTSLFSKQQGVRPRTGQVGFSSLSEDQRLFLMAPFSSEEVKRAVWDCGSDKAPGPDGFTFGFIKRYWDVLAEDVMSFVSAFHGNPVIPKGCNASFFTVIPKIRDPKHVKDFRPISLIGCQYKIIGKLLANRLAWSLVVLSVWSNPPLFEIDRFSTALSCLMRWLSGAG